MKTCLKIIIIPVILLIVTSCSNKTSIPTSPDAMPSQSENQTSEVQILGAGTMNLENGTIDFTNRESSFYLNVTALVGSNFSYYINGLIPPDTLDIILSLNNASGLTVYDVCIVFDKLYGKTVVNPDSYMDIFEPWDIDPFIAFRKEIPNRSFPPIADSEQLLLRYPGGNPMVDFFIIAHLGANTGGVYQISDWQIDGLLTTIGGQVNVDVHVLDHQGNVTSVVAATNALTGGLTFFTQTGNPEIWEGIISNIQHAPVGVYTIPIMAKSPSSPTYQTYNYFDLEVVPATDATTFSIDIGISGDDVFPAVETYSQGHHSFAADGDNFYLAFYASNGTTSAEGAVYFTKSTNGGQNWSTAVAITDELNNHQERYPVIALGNTNIYIAYTANYSYMNTGDVKLLVSSDEGVSWDEYFPSESLGKHCLYPSICVDKDFPTEAIYISFIELDTVGNNCKVARTYYNNLGAYVISTVNDMTMLPMRNSSIAFDSGSNHLLVCWSDFSADLIGGGCRVMFDWLDISNFPNWNTDTPISDHWNSTDYEFDPSLAVNPSTGNLGVLYRHEILTGTKEIRFIDIAHNPQIVIAPSALLYSTDADLHGPSLVCESSGRFLSAWFARTYPEPYSVFF
ncbi:MAG: hypothetical protein ABIG42_03530, partial [bacterium]